MILTNLSLFIFFFTLYVILMNFYKKNNFNPNDHDKKSFLINLDKYYIKDIYFVYFMVVVYFILNTLIFVIFRIQFLGVSKIVDISVDSFIIVNILNIFIFMGIIILYFQILNTVFYSYLIQLHFYLYQKIWYVSLNDIIRDNDMKLADISRNCAIFCDNLYENNVFIKQKKYLSYIFKKFSHYSMKVSSYISRFFYYLPYTIIILILIYDLYYGCLFYIYYMSLIFLFINTIRKYRKFLYVKDVVYDTIISNLFYKNEVQYLFLRKQLLINSDNIKIKFDELSKVLHHRTEIIEYFKEDFQVYYVLDKQRKKANKLFFSRAKRFNLLLLLFLASIFILYNYSKYQIFIFDIYKLNANVILFPLLIITYLFESRIFYEIPKSFTYEINKYYYNLFYFLIVIQIILLYFILLKNRITSMPDEILLDLKCFKIIENYTIEDKKAYLEQYLNILNNIEHFDQMENWDWTAVKEKIKEIIKITQDTSLQNIRDAVLDYLKKYANNPKQQEHSFIQRIFIWLFKK